MTTSIFPAVGHAPRLMLYAHDTYGLGHLRRSLAIAGHLAGALPDLSMLLVTGSPVAHSFTLPPRVDYVKLPSVVKTDDEQYRARILDISPERIMALRATLIANVAQHFAPDVLLVDHAPLGMKGELLPALRMLRRDAPEARLVLGLRDVLDDPRKVRRQWAAQDTYAAIESFYDAVLVYGQREIVDPVMAYAFPPALAARTQYCGYIQREEPVRPAAALRAELGLDVGPFVLVTAGGGGDGHALEAVCLEALAHLSGRHALQAVVITGPLMQPEERARLEERARALGRPVRVLPFHPDVPGLLRAAALVVAMGGYNTMCEIVTAGCPAVIVPRTSPRLEQEIRARAFAAHGLVTMLPPADLTPAHLASVMVHVLRQGPPAPEVRARWDGAGLSRIAALIADLLPARQSTGRRVPA